MMPQFSSPLNLVSKQIQKKPPIQKLNGFHKTSPIGGEPIPRGIRMLLVKKHRPLGIISNMEPYDILQDLDAIQPTITMKQLLAMSPECCTTLTFSLVCRRQWNKEIHEVSLNPN